MSAREAKAVATAAKRVLVRDGRPGIHAVSTACGRLRRSRRSVIKLRGLAFVAHVRLTA